MKSIFGRINLNNKPIDQTLLNKSIDQLKIYTNIFRDSLIENMIGLGQVCFGSKHQQIDQTSKVILLSDSAIYNKDELAKALSINDEILSDDNIILRSYEKWGKDCIHHIVGDFAFVIWDSINKELFCARDHFGVKPFYYCSNGEVFVFSSTLPAILEQSDLRFSYDKQYIADSISIIKSENSRTTYNEIKKLPPAHCLYLKEGELFVEQYWNLVEQKEIVGSDIEIISEFKSILTESVKCRIEKQLVIGAELSGGIDSSGVTAIASQYSELKTFSHVLPDEILGKIHPYQDERQFIDLLIDFCNISDKHSITSEEYSLLETLQQNLDDFNEVMQVNFGIFSNHLYKKAMNEGVSVLLSGFGGDEMVSSKSSGYLNELASIRQWKKLKNDLKNQNKRNQFYKYYIKEKLPNLTKIYQKLNLKKQWWESKIVNLAINKSFFEDLNVKENYIKYHKRKENKSLQERNIDKITHPHVAQRLECCSLISRRYGIEYRYPLLDKRLVEYYLSVPVRLKARNGIGRYIMRKAIDGIVPKNIQWRNDKSGTTIPTVYMRLLNDKEDIFKVIQRVKDDEIIKQFIDIDKFEIWFNNLCNRSESTQKNTNPGAFYNYLKLIFLIENNPDMFK